MIAACDIFASVGAVVVECACMVELKALGGYVKLLERHPSTKVRSSCSVFLSLRNVPVYF